MQHVIFIDAAAVMHSQHGNGRTHRMQSKHTQPYWDSWL